MNIIKKFIELKNDFKLFIIEGFLIILVSLYINFAKGEEDFRIIFIFLLFSFYVFLISLKYIIKYSYLFFLKFKKQVIFMFKLALLITCFYLIYKAKFLIEDINMYENTFYDKNKKEIIIEDKSIIDNELNANGKDIIIILDWFERSSHGSDVSNRLNGYFKYYLKKEIDIKIINLSFNENNDDIEHIDLMNNIKKDKFDLFRRINKESYSFETYIKKIRELNPNSKVVLSLSLHRNFFKNDIIFLSKKHNFKIAQGYFNNGFLAKSYSNEDKNIEKTYFNVMFWFNFIMNKTNTIVISTLDYTPFLWINYITINNINFSNQIIKNDFNNYCDSASFLTPILGYEYYLNKNSNYIKKDNSYYLFD